MIREKNTENGQENESRENFLVFNDPKAFAIYTELGKHEGKGCSVDELLKSLNEAQPEALKIAQSVVSYHLSRMKKSGFLQYETKGKHNIYRLTEKAIELHEYIKGSVPGHIKKAASEKKWKTHATPSMFRKTRGPVLLGEYADLGSENGEKRSGLTVSDPEEVFDSTDRKINLLIVGSKDISAAEKKLIKGKYNFKFLYQQVDNIEDIENFKQKLGEKDSVIIIDGRNKSDDDVVDVAEKISGFFDESNNPKIFAIVDSDRRQTYYHANNVHRVFTQNEIGYIGNHVLAVTSIEKDSLAVSSWINRFLSSSEIKSNLWRK